MQLGRVRRLRDCSESKIHVFQIESKRRDFLFCNRNDKKIKYEHFLLTSISQENIAAG